MKQWADIHDVYFLGIGGIGISGLAHYFHFYKKNVSGYDRVRSVVCQRLEKKGIKIFYTLDEEHVTGKDLVVYTPAVGEDNPELVKARALGIPTLKRAKVLGMISEHFRTAAVAGTHGKTTTSSMLTHLLQQGGVDTSAFLGGISLSLDANFALGTSDWMVAEADEYDRSFLHLKPEISIITAMDADHLDIYGSHAALKESFKQFATQTKERLVVHESLVEEGWSEKAETYGVDAGNVRAKNLRYQGLTTQFDVEAADWRLKDVEVKMPGEHNVSNMVGAMTVAKYCGVSSDSLKQAAASFPGIYRRFQVIADIEGLSYVDDYAHHPAEIAAVMDTARQMFPDRQLVVIFQPHLFSRTQDFAEGFAEELSKADVAFLMEIYPAREEPIEGVNTQMLVDMMEDGKGKLVAREDMLMELEYMIQGPTMLMTLGAGDIDKEVEKIKNWIEQKHT